MDYIREMVNMRYMNEARKTTVYQYGGLHKTIKPKTEDYQQKICKSEKNYISRKINCRKYKEKKGQ